MKKVFLLLNFIAFSFFLSAQGIAWEPTIDGAFTKSKATGKPVFVECYHPNCPICMALEPTLKNAEVGKFYNKNFVNYKLNLSDPNHVKFLNTQKMYLTGYPLFLYFDSSKKLLHHRDPENSPERLIAHGGEALNPDVRSGDMKKKYDAGNRDLNTLVSLSYLLHLTLDTTQNLKIAKELFDVYPKEELNSKTSWVITKKCVMDIENGFAEHWFNNISVAAQFEAAEGHAGSEQAALGNLIQTSLYSAKGFKYTIEQLRKVRKYMGLVGASAYADGVLWQHEGRAYLRNGQTSEAVKVAEKISQTDAFSKNGMALVYLVTFFNDNSLDNQYANSAKNWLQKGRMLLKENKDLAEYHFQKARMEQKSNNLELAKKEAEQAKMYASLSKLDLKRFNSLIESVK